MFKCDPKKNKKPHYLIIIKHKNQQKHRLSAASASNTCKPSIPEERRTGVRRRVREAYQQSPDQPPHVVGHAGSLGVTGRQLDQSDQEVLALLHTFQSLLLTERSQWCRASHLPAQAGSCLAPQVAGGPASCSGARPAPEPERSDPPD